MIEEFNWIHVHRIRPTNISLSNFYSDLNDFSHLQELETLKITKCHNMFDGKVSDTNKLNLKLMKLNSHIRHLEVFRFNEIVTQCLLVVTNIIVYY